MFEERSPEGLTPLLTAVLWNRIDTATELLEHGADIDGRGQGGRIALQLACIGVRQREIEYDLDAGEGNSWAIRSAMLKFLLEHGADVRIPDVEGRTALHFLCQSFLPERKDINVCPLAPVKGSPVAESTQEPPSRAADIHMVKALLDRGANINAVDQRGETSLFMASSTPGNKDLVMELLRQGADVTIAAGSGVPPLHNAIRLKNLDVVKALVRHPQQDIEQQDSKGWTPLQTACYTDHPTLPILELLLRRGAKAFTARTEDGRSAYDIARRHGDRDILELMQRLSWDNIFGPTEFATRKVPYI